MMYKLYRADSVREDGTNIPAEEFNYTEVTFDEGTRFCFNDWFEAEKMRLVLQAQDATGYYKIEKSSR